MKSGPLPNVEHHTMRHIGSRLNYHEFICDICGRHILIHMNPPAAGEGARTFVILNKGNVWAAHSGETGGLVLNGIEVTQERATDPTETPEHEQNEDPTELSEDWNGWLADILDDRG